MTRTAFQSLLLALLLAFDRSTLHAQVALRDTVRIVNGSNVVRGLLVSMDSASIVIRDDDGDTSYPLASVGRPEVLRGRRRAGGSSMGKGAAIGAGVGALLGVVAIAAPAANQESRALAPLFAVATVTLGTATGAVIGAIGSFRTVDRWERFDLTTYRGPGVAAVPVLAEIGAGATIRLYVGDKRDPSEWSLVRSDTSALVVREPRGSGVLTIPVSEIRRAEVRQGPAVSGARTIGRGALIGAGIGTMLGMMGANGGGQSGLPRINVAPIVFGALVGTLAGGVSALTRSDDWREFDPARVAGP